MSDARKSNHTWFAIMPAFARPAAVYVIAVASIAMGILPSLPARAADALTVRSASPLGTDLGSDHYLSYSAPVLRLTETGLSPDNGIALAKLELIQSKEKGTDRSLWVEFAFFSDRPLGLTSVRDYGKFGRIWTVGEKKAVLLPTLSLLEDELTDIRKSFPEAQTWPAGWGRQVFLDRIVLKAYAMSNTPLVLSLSDYEETGSTYKVRIPPDYLAAFLDAIPNNQHLFEGIDASRMRFGAQVGTLPHAALAEIGLPEPGGVRVLGVASGSVADKAGLKNYDVLMRMNGEQLEKPQDLVDAVRAVAPGARVSLTVWRLSRAFELEAQF